ncbi:ATP-binding protein [Phytohabitans houttuyneae]|uniref:ATP-binding protein n=2 Tax=Phytohabitans houttuyneae TaxID=1076126 RepID=A0A6V8KDV4_9ACTN|nr:ATP-binding protein [Phytohabitans houttuyneae]
MPGLDKLPEGPLRDFVAAIHEIYDVAGQPAARVIAKATVALPSEFQSVSHETASAMLRASTVPAWEKVRSMLHVLASMAPFDYDSTLLEQRTVELWRRARHELQDTVPPHGEERARPIAPAATVAEREEPAPLIGFRPSAAPGFIGREGLIESIHTTLHSGPDVRLVLHGPIGAGKTQAVLQYLDRHTAADDPVWWVPSATTDAARTSLIDLAAALKIERHHRVDRTVKLVLDGLASRRFPYLMVFDGLDEPGLLSLVPNGGHVIITTRDPALGDNGSRIGVEVPDLTDDEAELLLREHIPDAAPEAREKVVEAYGRNPLALRQTVAWWRDTTVPVEWSDGALLAYRMAAGAVDGYGRSASLTVLFALDRLEAASRQALVLLEALSFFAAAPVSKDLLGRGTVAQNETPTEMPQGELALNKAIIELRRHGLVRYADGGRQVEVLPLVRHVVRHALSGGEAERARCHAHTLLATADPGPPDDLRPVEIYREIAAHLDATDLVTSAELKARTTVYHQIRFHYLYGEYTAACDLGERAYRAWRVGNDPSGDDHLVLRTSQEWANALRAVGRYEKAAELTRSAMSELRVDPAYGERHSYTLATAGSRAADLRIAGDYRRALEFDEDTLRQCRDSIGDDQPRTIMSRHNFAISLRLTGRFREAEEVDRIALRQHRDAFGEDNWQTLLSINALAEDLNGQGRYQDVLNEVEPMLERIETRERTRMERGLMFARRALALARRGIGRLEDALALLDTSYDECARLFGEHHEYPLALQMSRANTLHLLGRADDAIEQASSVIDSYGRLFGPRNPLTVAAQINLANVLRARGELGQAMRIDGASSEALLDKVGQDHPFAVAAAVNLASDYAQSGHPNRLTASRRAVELAKRVHPRPDHPDVIAAEANLAVDLIAVDGPKASSTRQRVLQQVEGLYGQDHPMVSTITRGDRLDCVIEPPLL